MEQRVALAKERIAAAQKVYDENQAFLNARGPLERASDLTVYGVSQPLRAVTQGQYGFGDLAGAVTPWGDQYREQEQNFQRANPGIVGALHQAAGAGLGVPMLRGMGHVEGGFNALRTAPGAAKVIIREAEQAAQEAAPEAVPANALAPRPGALVGPEARLRSIQDFQDANIPVFAPSLASKGVARTARTIEETPLIGGTVKVPKNEVEAAAAAEQARITQDLGSAQSKDEAGLIAQSGLDRFRTARLQDLERKQLERLDINPERPAPAGAADSLRIDRPSQLNTAAMSDAELRMAAQARVQFPQSMRSTIEDLSPRELQRIIDAPANETSFATKQSALYKRADDAMPQIMRDDESRNPNLFAQRESAVVARGLLQQEQSSSVRASILNGRFGPLVERMTNPSANMTIESMRAARTEIGRALSEGNQLDASLSRTQLKQLYGALTNDVQRALVGVAARARIQERAGRLPAGVADQADRALHLTRIADRYTRAGMERMDRFMGVLGANSIEQAGQRIAQYLRDNTQNVRALDTVASALRPEEWRSVLGHVIDNLGRLPPGAREAERVFSFERFATDFNKISQSPRVQAIFERGIGQAHFAALQRLARVAERMKYYETTKNYSGSAYAGAGIAGAGALFSLHTIAPVVGGFLAMGGAGKLLTSQAFASWLSGVYTAEMRGGNAIGVAREMAGNELSLARGAYPSRQIGKLRDAITRERDPQTKDLMKSLANALVQGPDAEERYRARSRMQGQKSRQ